ncbi:MULTISPECIES: AlpA family phage regulatory protein [unclassified Lysobacter]|uniref:AlpA family phage regulatory protein n=1 Tax=unclassified Lysobacter TaxID=2635362 RepID=UPI002035CB46|nr:MULTISPECIES: AlpA family phage regulatory protein [unclassified Lysobacter]
MHTTYAVAKATADATVLPAVCDLDISDGERFFELLRSKSTELGWLLRQVETHIDEQHQRAKAARDIDEMQRLEDADPYRWFADAKHSLQAGLMFLERAVTQSTAFHGGGVERRLIRLPQVVERTGLSRSTIYRRVAEGGFPRPVNPRGSLSAWVEDEVNAWINAEIMNRDAKSGFSSMD